MTFATIEAAKSAQNAARDYVWEMIRKFDDYDHVEVVAANAKYDATVNALREMLGPDAHCAEVDCDLYGTYSDLYKDRCNFRPRGHITYEAVKAYVDNCKDSDIHDDEGDDFFNNLDNRIANMYR
jgi:hypothetical protein